MSNSVKYIAIRLGIAAFIISLLANATQSLIIYVGGNALTDQAGGVLAFSLGTFIVGTLFSTLVHFFIFGVAAFMGIFLYSFLMKPKGGVGTPTPTAGGDAAIKGFIKKFLAVVATIAVLLAGYQTLGVYVALSAVSEASGLILLTSALAFVTTLIYGVAVVGFIGAVGTFIVLMLMAFFGGRSNTAGR